MTLTDRILAEIPGNPLKGLQNADRLWQSYREGTRSIAAVVTENLQELASIDFDVVICGGTLGILLATALVQRGWKVAVIERGILQGREQEWNISRQELSVLTEMALLNESELARSIATEFNPVRISFDKGTELYVDDILNVGVSPAYLLETLKTKFLSAGGQLLENIAFEQAIVYPNGIQLTLSPLSSPLTAASGQGGTATFQSTHSATIAPQGLGERGEGEVSGGEVLSTRLLIDAMGHFSPIAQQARQGQKPDAVCLVVGTCATGFPQNQTGDLMASVTPIENQCQYFWEAFPARDGRTTYLFTYVDAAIDRPSLTTLFEEYFRLLPNYQSIDLAQLQFHRALFGFFPCYRQSPLQLPWGRMLAVGDSAGGQSPLSFGGFGAMLRHLPRLTTGIDAALSGDRLTQSDLALLQPYQPNLAVTWLFQRSMSVGMQQRLPPDQINQLLSAVFQTMMGLGDRVLRPFLQDVVQFPALFQTLILVSLRHPLIVLKIIPQVGLGALMTWLFHYINLGLYSFLNGLTNQIVNPIAHQLVNARMNQGRSTQDSPEPSTQSASSCIDIKYTFDRWRDAWHYGSGGDYRLHKDD